MSLLDLAWSLKVPLTSHKPLRSSCSHRLSWEIFFSRRCFVEACICMGGRRNMRLAQVVTLLEHQENQLKKQAFCSASSWRSHHSNGTAIDGRFKIVCGGCLGETSMQISSHWFELEPWPWLHPLRVCWRHLKFWIGIIPGLRCCCNGASSSKRWKFSVNVFWGVGTCNFALSSDSADSVFECCWMPLP